LALSEVWSALKRQRLVLVAVVAAFGLATWIFLLAWPRAYLSEAKLFVRVGRESVGLDPTASMGQTMLLQKTQDEEINSALEILSSRHIREMVVDDLGPSTIIDGLPSPPGAGTSLNKFANACVYFVKDVAYTCLDWSMIRDPISDRERAIQKLEAWTHIYAPKRATVITIACRSHSPGLAQLIVKSYTGSYMSEHVRIRESEDSLAFFTDKTERLKADLASQEIRLREYKDQHGVLSLASNESLINDKRGTLDGLIQQANAELKNVLARQKEIRSQIEKHRHRSTRNKLEEDLLADIISEKGLEAQIAKLESQREQLSSEQLIHGEDELLLQDMERDLAVTEAIFLQVQEKLEESRINKQLDARKISNLSLAQPATFVEKPISPKKPLIVAAALIFTMLLAPALALWRDSANNPARSVEQVEQVLGMPVVATLPRPGRFERRNGARRGCLQLIQRLQAELQSSSPGSVGIVGSTRSAGSSHVSRHLATIASDHFGLSTLLVDADRRHRTVSTTFGLNGAPGLGELSAKRVQVLECVQSTQVEKLDILGPISKDTKEELGLNHGEAQECLSDLTRKYDFVVVDLPASDSLNPEFHLPSLMDSVFIVTERDKISLIRTSRLVRSLREIGTTLRGVVVVGSE